MDCIVSCSDDAWLRTLTGSQVGARHVASTRHSLGWQQSATLRLLAPPFLRQPYAYAPYNQGTPPSWDKQCPLPLQNPASPPLLSLSLLSPPDPATVLTAHLGANSGHRTVHCPRGRACGASQTIRLHARKHTEQMSLQCLLPHPILPGIPAWSCPHSRGCPAGGRHPDCGGVTAAAPPPPSPLPSFQVLHPAPPTHMSHCPWPARPAPSETDPAAAAEGPSNRTAPTQAGRQALGPLLQQGVAAGPSTAGSQAAGPLL
jgi:hypothetical protein